MSLRSRLHADSLSGCVRTRSRHLPAPVLAHVCKHLRRLVQTGGVKPAESDPLTHPVRRRRNEGLITRQSSHLFFFFLNTSELRTEQMTARLSAV